MCVLSMNVCCILLCALYQHVSIHPSIHPSSSAYLGPGRRGSCLSRDSQTSLSPDTSSSSSGRIPRRVEEQWLYSELLPGDRAPHLSLSEHPATLRRRLILATPGSYSFGHDPNFLTVGEGRNVDWPVNRELHLSAPLSLHHDRPIQRPLMRLPNQSACQSHAPSFPHSMCVLHINVWFVYKCVLRINVCCVYICTLDINVWFEYKFVRCV